MVYLSLYKMHGRALHGLWKVTLDTAAFTIFLCPRMPGCAAKIDDHMNRGRNMDTRTPASPCQFVA